MTAFKNYLREIHDQTGYMASWLPNTVVQVGDIGQLRRGQRFERRSSLSELGVGFQTRDGQVPATFDCVSAGTKLIHGDLKAAATANDLGQLEGSVNVTFSRKHGVVFRATHCRLHTLIDRNDLYSEIDRLRRIGIWQRDWCLVVEVVAAENLTVLVAASGSASATLSANAASKHYDLADVTVGLRVNESTDLAVQVVAQGSTTPLFRIGRFKLLGGFAEVAVSSLEPAEPGCEYADMSYDDLAE